MFCSKCGKEINDEAVVCVHCGCAVENKTANTALAGDAPNTGYAVLGFFIPVVGLILYLMNINTYPLRAKSAGKGALISVILSVVFYVLYVVVFAALGTSLYKYI